MKIKTPCHVCIYFSASFFLLPLHMLSISTSMGTLGQPNPSKYAGPSKRRKKYAQQSPLIVLLVAPSCCLRCDSCCGYCCSFWILLREMEFQLSCIENKEAIRLSIFFPSLGWSCDRMGRRCPCGNTFCTICLIQGSHAGDFGKHLLWQQGEMSGEINTNVAWCLVLP
jgi:hypothetical protein